MLNSYTRRKIFRLYIENVVGSWFEYTLDSCGQFSVSCISLAYLMNLIVRAEYPQLGDESYLFYLKILTRRKIFRLYEMGLV